MADEDIVDSDGETGEDAEEIATEAGASDATNGLGGGHCLSCGATMMGVFCTNCGQKNDDLRRSLFLLARDFVEDTFSFDGRMWRTLGILVTAPGLVPTLYAHGKRSRFTPPVRLFLVVSFLFFLLLSLTKTLFVAIEISNYDPNNQSMFLIFSDDDPQEDQDGDTVNGDCSIQGSLVFFKRASEFDNDEARWNKCLAQVKAETQIAIEETNENGQTMSEDEKKRRRTILENVSNGLSAAVVDPQSFNAVFNSWLPRVMFLMTPIAALIMGVFIRGRDALFFDHMVLALYSHATAFATIGAAIIAMQFGIPFTGIAAASVLLFYFIFSVKRAYGRGWIKTIYSSLFGGLIYMIILLAVVGSIVARIMLQPV